MSRLALLSTTTEESYARLRKRLDGLTDDEYFWEPVRGCWNIYQDAAGRWTYHYEIPDPDPAPATSIGWQVVHLATCKIMYREWAYGPARLTFPNIAIPNTAGGAISMLDQAHLRLRGELAGLSEGQLDDLVKTNWGELWPAWRIFSTMADHDALHGGAIGNLRDLYHYHRKQAGKK